MLLQIPFSLPPEIFSIGPLTVRWYGLCWAMGFAIGYFVMQRIFRREGENEAWLDWLLLILVLCSVLGARLGHVFFYDMPADPERYLSRPWEVFAFWKGGMASHGGFIGLVLAFFLFSKYVSKKPVLWGSDRVVLPTAIAAGLIRVGNFFNQEIVGIFTDVPWAVQFVLRGETMGRHPAQLYEAICYFGIAAFLFFLYFRKEGGKNLGFLTGVFLSLTFTARFLIEFVKPVQESFEESIFLNMGQWLSIPIVLFGLYLIWRSGRFTAAQNA
ncbi:MAG: prolipoprotein diacylglyceryl transferase [Bacteroidota bacterium]